MKLHLGRKLLQTNYYLQFFYKLPFESVRYKFFDYFGQQSLILRYFKDTKGHIY
jgi:hypothetical protein